jgi:hypothetical protein
MNDEKRKDVSMRGTPIGRTICRRRLVGLQGLMNIISPWWLVITLRRILEMHYSSIHQHIIRDKSMANVIWM